MILAVIPLIPLAVIGGAAALGGIVGWIKGRSRRIEESEAQEKENRKMRIRLFDIAARQQQHEDDLNGIVANLETGQTAEEEKFGIPARSSKDLSNTTKKDDIKKDNEIDDRFELMDL